MGYTPPYLEVRTISGGWKIYPPTNTTGDDLLIYPNGTDTTPYIKLYGNGGMNHYLSGANAIVIYSDANNFLQIGYTAASNHSYILNPMDGKDIYLSTTGAGVIKFGTYTAGAATDSTGYITIKDAAGNTRKLMVQA